MYDNNNPTVNVSRVRKGFWSVEEDDLLRKCIHKYGEGNWKRIPQRAGLNRCRKSCRWRWLNYLKPSIKRGDFSDDEIGIIVKQHKLLGNRWSLIAGRLPGRTINDVKNYCNTHIYKKFSSQAISSNKVCNVIDNNGFNTQNGKTNPPPSTTKESNGSKPINPLAFDSLEEHDSGNCWEDILGELMEVSNDNDGISKGLSSFNEMSTSQYWEEDLLEFDVSGDEVLNDELRELYLSPVLL